MMKTVRCAWFVVLAASVSLAAAADQPAGKVAAGATTDTAAVMGKTVPADVLAQMNDLVEKAVQVASAPLQTSDAFLPYAVLLKADNSLQYVRWTLPQSPPAAEVLRLIRMSVIEAAKGPDVVAAVTVAGGSTMTTDGMTRVNGLHVEADHRRGEPRTIFMPYLRDKGKLVFGTMVYLPGINALFGHGQASATPTAAVPAATKPAAATKSAAKKPAATAPAATKAKSAAVTK